MLHDTQWQALPERLRAETSGVHRRLEAEMDFERHPPDLRRLKMMVGRFYGVHAVLEPKMGRHLDPALLAGRQKLSLLIEDLQTLGMSAGEIPALPTCTALNEVVDTADGALGALYVLEGSTLGGKVITRLLRQSPVWPIKGIRYFDPYGSETGQMWRSFKIYLSSIGEADRQDRIVCGAKATFSLMEGWLRPAFPTPR